MDIKDFKIDLDKLIIAGPSKNSKEFADVKLYGDGSTLINEDVSRKIQYFLKTEPEMFIEKIILDNIKRDKINTYEKYQIFSKTSNSKRIDSWTHLTSQKYELYLSSYIATKMPELAKKLKAIARKDISETAIDKLKDYKGNNLLVVSYPNLVKEKLFVMGEEPLVYVDITSNPNIDYIKKVLDVYEEINGLVRYRSYSANSVTFENENGGILKLSDTSVNHELKEVSVSLMRRR